MGMTAGLRIGIMAGERAANPVVVIGMRMGIMAGLRLRCVYVCMYYVCVCVCVCVLGLLVVWLK